MSTAQVVESSTQRWQPAVAATALSMTASTASTASSKTQRIVSLSSTTSSSKNWRGKYLRALNISTPEVDVVSRKKHTPTGTSGGARNPTATTTAALGTVQQRRTRGYRVDPNNRSVTFSRSFSTSTEREGDEFQARVNRYQVSQAARYSSNSSRRGGVVTKEPLSTPAVGTNGNDYGFMMKPDLARGRRCHTDPFVIGDLDGGDDTTNDKMASAPIQIPSAAASSMDFRSIGGKLSDIDGATTINKNYSSKRYGSKSPVKNQSSKSSNNNNNNQDVATGNLLSWEEPAVMMGCVAVNGSKPAVGGGAGLGGLDIAFSNVQINSRSIDMTSVGDDGVFCDEFVDTEDEDDRDDNGESHDDSESDSCGDDEIFEMEDFDSDSSMNVNSSSNNKKFRSSENNSSSKTKSRRRRTASASQATVPPLSRRSSALPRYHSVRQMRANGTPSSPTMELPESFVPPHQMIQRDCFSIGLRDEFKRRQAKI